MSFEFDFIYFLLNNRAVGDQTFSLSIEVVCASFEKSDRFKSIEMRSPTAILNKTN